MRVLLAAASLLALALPLSRAHIGEEIPQQFAQGSASQAWPRLHPRRCLAGRVAAAACSPAVGQLQPWPLACRPRLRHPRLQAQLGWAPAVAWAAVQAQAAWAPE